MSEPVPQPPQPAPPSDASSVSRTLTRLFVWAAAIGLGLYFFDALALVLLMFLAAAAIAAVLRPLVGPAMGLRRGLSGSIVALSFWLLVVAMMAGLGLLLTDAVRQRLGQWGPIKAQLNESLAWLSGELGLRQPLNVDAVVSQATGWLLGSEPGDVVALLANSLGAGLIAVLLLVFGSIYLLSEQRGALTRPLEQLLGSRPPASPLRDALGDLEPKLRWWLLGTLISMAVTGLVTWLGLWIVGLEFALPLGVLAGFAELVPILGPASAFLVIVLVAMGQGTGAVIGVLIVYMLVQTLESYVLLPMIMRQAVRIPPIVTLFTLVLWSRLLGPLGLLLAIPIDLTIWSFVDHFVLRRREETADERR